MAILGSGSNKHFIRQISATLARGRHAMSFSPPYKYITASSLADAWKAQGSTNKAENGSAGWAIVDVRDDDFQGGHIKGCWNVPSTQFPDRVAEVVQRLQQVQNVVFHCSLSQARGPKAARIYREARDEAIQAGSLKNSNPEQSVLVLRDGFSNFGAVYKKDADLVVDYDEESWKYR